MGFFKKLGNAFGDVAGIGIKLAKDNPELATLAAIGIGTGGFGLAAAPAAGATGTAAATTGATTAGTAAAGAPSALASGSWLSHPYTQAGMGLLSSMDSGGQPQPQQQMNEASALRHLQQQQQQGYTPYGRGGLLG